ASVKGNGRVIQGYPAIIHKKKGLEKEKGEGERKEEDNDEEGEEEEDDEDEEGVCPSSPALLGRDQVVYLRDEAEGPRGQGAGQNSSACSWRKRRRRQQQQQQGTLVTLDPSNLSPSTAELAAKAEENRGQLRHLNQE
ncbi:hypothetical protein CRUP_027522, partial [Coryphaenoides rupestris]